MRERAGHLALSLVVAIVATGCTSGGAQSSGSGGHLIIGTTSNIDTLNPFVTFQQNSYAAFEYIYPQLVQYNDQMSDFLPDFASSWKTSSDGLTWTFDTAPNATWSDGQPLTANDAAFTFNTILKYGDGPAGNLIGGLANVTKVEATDDNTLVVRYSVPAANVLPELHPAGARLVAVRNGRREGPADLRERSGRRPAARQRRAVRTRAVQEGPGGDLPTQPGLLWSEALDRRVRAPVLLER